MKHYLDHLVSNVKEQWPLPDFDDTRRWSYGDVENNGVFYHPQMTHYAHQAFESYFYRDRGIHYSDLSGRDQRHQDARQHHIPVILSRITFPVLWLHQWMLIPMTSGDLFHTGIDTVDLPDRRIGVRAHVYNEDRRLAGLVIWVRAAKLLEPAPEVIDIPEWFPRRS